MKNFLMAFFFLGANILNINAQISGLGFIKGVIIEQKTGEVLEFAHVTLSTVTDSIISQTTTDKMGSFVFNNITNGAYIISYSFIGFDKQKSQPIILNQKNNKVNAGKLKLIETSTALGQVEVIGQRSTFTNSIDRKTFNVGQDLLSKSGSVSDLMQNIPSVQVDVDGNVSLRGSENVTILINGKSSAMMNLNRAAVLQQMSANTIEKIEIITNPSAKFKPDGTSGIINIVLRKDKSLGFNGNITANIGNENRRNFNVLANYNPGKLNIFSSIGIRREDRIRINDINTTTFTSPQVVDEFSKSYSYGLSKSTSYIGSAGFDYSLNDNNSFGSSLNYNYRDQIRNDSAANYLQDNNHIFIYDYNRERYLPEIESDLESTSFFQHKFDKKGHELLVNFVSSISRENEDNYYTNTYRKPSSFVKQDNMFYHHINKESELSVEYSLPMANEGKFEAGYLLEHLKNDLDLNRDTLNNATSVWSKDVSKSNRFIHSENTHVLYATYEKEVGNFGFLLGVRTEQTISNSNLLTLDSLIKIQYTRLYPTAHLSYKLSEINELQLNYSHRINRPDDEDLNPFPEYQDLNNIRAGNPYLKPEDIHSIELGYQYKKETTTFLSTLYYRSHYNSMTSIVKNLGNSVFLSTLENLGKNQSAGMELILATSFGKFANLNLATNTFYNTIDASALGFSENKSNVSWSANANLNFNLTKSTILQFTSNYTAETLTPQGKRLPSFVLNTGLKQELFKKKAALILTVSDVFNTNRSTYKLETPEIQRIEMRRRSSQAIYLGFTYSFGNSNKKQKETTIKYDNQL